MTETNTKLYIVHAGYYEKDLGCGVFEAHTNFFIAAPSPEEAKRLAKTRPVWIEKKMHADGILEIQAVEGFRVKLEADASLAGKDIMQAYGYSQLNPAN